MNKLPINTLVTLSYKDFTEIGKVVGYTVFFNKEYHIVLWPSGTEGLFKPDDLVIVYDP